MLCFLQLSAFKNYVNTKSYYDKGDAKYTYLYDIKKKGGKLVNKGSKKTVKYTIRWVPVGEN